MDHPWIKQRFLKMLDSKDVTTVKVGLKIASMRKIAGADAKIARLEKANN